ncbi:MAG: polyprenyl synthetase family protein [Candidatus Aenigmarchaeota archaeon]|nr:polyprenyl synthetase family protein [Candidatus Aenigmarchaeota archaeon]
MDIEKLLESRSKLVDKAIEKYIPRKYGKKTAEFTFGKTTYRYSLEAATKSLSEPIWDLLDRGGKRWRPALFMMVIEALGAKPEKYLDLVVPIEVIHNGSLIIDDKEDSSEMRRGKPCTYKLFGDDIAINAGNAMYYLPLLVLLKNKMKLPQERLLKLYEIYSQELINIHLGQGMDIAWHRGLCRPSGAEGYLQMCAFKTGTLARIAAKFGAVVAGATDDAVEKLGRLAESIGIAFQIQDDILDITSDSSKWGKAYGNDIHEGKRTLMVIHAMQHKKGKRLLEILGMHTTDKKLVDEAISILKKAGSAEYAKDYARSLVGSAWKDAKPLLKKADVLEAFVRFATERKY